MNMLNPAMSGRQYHVSYDLVRLPTGRMSGRRGRYLLADDLYEELKARGRSMVLLCKRFSSDVIAPAQEVIRTTMREKYAAKGEPVTEEFFNAVTHEARSHKPSFCLRSRSHKLSFCLRSRLSLSPLDCACGAGLDCGDEVCAAVRVLHGATRGVSMLCSPSVLMPAVTRMTDANQLRHQEDHVL
jgi:hypothetical protein